LDDRNGIQPVKNGCRFVGGDNLTGAWHFIALVVITIIATILSSNKIQNGDILVLA